MRICPMDSFATISREDEYDKLFLEAYLYVIELQEWEIFSKIDQKDYFTFSSCYVYSLRHHSEVKYFQANIEMYLAFLECIYIFHHHHHIIENKDLAWRKNDAKIYNFSPLEERLYTILFKSNNEDTPYTFYKIKSKIRILTEIKNIDYASRKAIYITEFNYLYGKLKLQFQKFYDTYKDRKDLKCCEKDKINGLARHLLENLEKWYSKLVKEYNIVQENNLVEEKKSHSNLNLTHTNFYITRLEQNKSILVSKD